MVAISLNPLPGLDSYAKAPVIVNTDSDKLLFRVMMKLLPETFLQRVHGTSIFASKSGIRLYHYLCNTVIGPSVYNRSGKRYILQGQG